MRAQGTWQRAWAAALIVLATSCSGHRASITPAPGSAKHAAAGAVSGPAWAVRIGSQGGFTGGGSGYVVRSDGTVFSWSRITPQDSITTRAAGVASGETLRALHAALESLDASKAVLARTGNMTVFLEWIEAPGPHRWSWPEGAPDAKLPSPVHRAYLAALAAAATARPAR